MTIAQILTGRVHLLTAAPALLPEDLQEAMTIIPHQEITAAGIVQAPVAVPGEAITQAVVLILVLALVQAQEVEEIVAVEAGHPDRPDNKLA